MNARLILAVALVAVPLLAGAQTAAPKAKPAATAPKKTAPAAPVTPAPAPAPAAAPVVAAPTGPVGSVALVTGVATVAARGETRALGAGDPIFEGQTISVGPNSYANLKFNDGGRVLLRPGTEFAVEQFRYTPPPAPAAASAASLAPAQPAAGNAFFRLVRGGFRAVTGLIGKGEQQAYRVTTPAATIGIRGTDYEVQTCSDDCPSQASAAAGYAEVAASSLAGLELAQAGGGGSGGGIIVATNEGSIVLRTSRGDTVVDVGQVALALANGQTFMLPTLPDAMLLNATPAPADCE